MVQFSTNPVTRTVFGTQVGSTLPTLWTDSYCVAISMNYLTAKKSTTPEVGSGSTTARFEAAIEDDSSGSYVFRAVSPYDSYVSINSSYKSVQFNVPTAQTPSATSPDEKAQILYGEEDAGSTFPSSVTMNFSHLTAYGKISFSNLALADGESVASVSLTAAKKWAGRFYYYVEDHDPYNAGDFAEGSASATITITTTSTSGIWFGCAPVDLGGEEVEVVITTNKGTTYSKTVTIPAGKVFASGKVQEFTVNMSGIVADGAVVYTLVDDVADLTLGSEIIIVAKDYDYAISTTQNSNNRAHAGVTKSAGTISSPGADVQVMTIANGNKKGTYAIKAESNYLYAVSNSNYLRTKNTLANDGSWFISVTDAGVATIKSIGTSDTRYLKYNDNNSIFSCYTSGQKDVCIYKKNGTGSGAITAKELESISISGAKTSYTLNDSYSFDGTVMGLFSDTSEEAISASDYTVNDSSVDMTSEGSYTVTITYNDDNSINTSYTITVSAGGGGASPTLQYTLTPEATGSNSSPHNSYTAAATVTIDGIGWSVMGNSYMLPWRIGGKNISGVDRAIYSTTAIPANISQIVITHGAASNITVNSMTVYVCSTAAGAAASTPTNVVASFTPSFAANDDVTINKVGNTSWANCFYRIVYNVTVSGNTNRFIEFSEAKFYGTN